MDLIVEDIENKLKYPEVGPRVMRPTPMLRYAQAAVRRS